jgi:hypothetical protein
MRGASGVASGRSSFDSNLETGTRRELKLRPHRPFLRRRKYPCAASLGASTYPLAGSARPHAVTSISSGNINTTFTYDPNGNQTAGLGRTISYTSFNKPSAITNGSSTLNFSHDIDHQRFKQQIAPEGTTTLYFDAFGFMPS